ncbi:hypothetical protein CFL01nite_10740 [Corynebacterium flavescens]|uniref:Uncharacterized protein n=1 Tax=Corynebacterium flavescens TaxID=28028 RepID=A0AB73B6Y0_CORFL|nr:hypothetical protein CFL01nite_10740 [Corynebacterium flavescens]
MITVFLVRPVSRVLGVSCVFAMVVVKNASRGGTQGGCRLWLKPVQFGAKVAYGGPSDH